MIRSVTFGLVFFAVIAESAAAHPDSTAVIADSLANTSVFHSEMVRIEIQKPATWHSAKVDLDLKNFPSARLSDEEFLEAVKKMNKRPLLSATKHEESYTGLNPSFQLIVRPAANLEGKSGVELLQLYIPRLSQAFTEFKLVAEPHAITVGGRPAGRMDVSYMITNQDGKKLPSRSTIVLVPDGKVVYQVGFTGPPEGPDKLTKEIDQVLSTVKWLN